MHYQKLLIARAEVLWPTAIFLTLILIMVREWGRDWLLHRMF
jgi:hypothetical protein